MEKLIPQSNEVTTNLVTMTRSTIDDRRTQSNDTATIQAFRELGARIPLIGAGKLII